MYILQSKYKYFKREDAMDLKNIIAVGKDGVEIKDLAGLRSVMDSLIYEAVFSEGDRKTAMLMLIKEACKAAGAVPASIQSLYEEMGRAYPGLHCSCNEYQGSHV